MTKKLTKKYPLQYGVANPVLRKQCASIDEITNDIRDFAHVLAELMRTYEGVGLAAPQIGNPIRMIAVTQRKGAKRGNKCLGQTIMLNPVITKHSTETFVSDEGCLSLPKREGDVRRYEKITVEFTDIHGQQHYQKYKHFDAAIIQHEIDHLDGVLFIDKLV